MKKLKRLVWDKVIYDLVDWIMMIIVYEKPRQTTEIRYNDKNDDDDDNNNKNNNDNKN